jgi:hypothetical protein
LTALHPRPKGRGFTAVRIKNNVLENMSNLRKKIEEPLSKQSLNIKG